MNRLYALRNANRELESIFFEKKMDAKQVRNELNKEGRDLYVTRGPDHMNYREKLKPNQEKKGKKNEW